MVNKLDLDRLRALVEAASPLPWVYRPDKYDDWGWIRGVERDDRDIGPFRPIVANAKDSLVRDEDMDAHRRAGTDPYGPNAELIVAAVNLIPTLLAQAATPANGEQVERITPALHEGGRFLEWPSVDLAAQCLSQAREQLDPEFSQFMTAVAARLAATPTEDARERVVPPENGEPDPAWASIKRAIDQFAGRVPKIGKHHALNNGHIAEVVKRLDAAGDAEAADTIVWQCWWRALDRERERFLLSDAAEQRSDARERVKVLEEALAAIRDGDVPRPVARQWRADGKPSKLDQCKHDVSVSEDCAGCTAEFVTTALGNKETDRHG